MESEAVNMRIDAYNAVNQIYQTSQISKAKTAAKTSSVSDKFEILTQPRHIRQPGQQ